MARKYLRAQEAPQWCHDGLEYYASFTVYNQLLINAAVICYLLYIQYYFFRYMVCESCFREYKQLSDDVEESARNLPARREEYKKQ